MITEQDFNNIGFLKTNDWGGSKIKATYTLKSENAEFSIDCYEYHKDKTKNQILIEQIKPFNQLISNTIVTDSIEDVKWILNRSIPFSLFFPNL